MLLVNFFSSSSALVNWAALLGVLGDTSSATRGMLRDGIVANDAPVEPGAGAAAAGGVSGFVQVHEKPLEHELRHAYVAFTRARSMLWVFEGPIPGDANKFVSRAHYPFEFLQRTVSVQVLLPGNVPPAAFATGGRRSRGAGSP